MKNKLTIIILAFALAILNIGIADAQIKLVHSSNGGGNTPTNYTYVDLGLPSGTLWATCNVGANNPWEAGDYFAWGETKPKSKYTWGNYKYAANGDASKLTKYCHDSQNGNNGFTDNLGVLQASDDAATVNMGSAWRMPAYKEWEELTKNCNCEWTNNYLGKGVKGYIVKNKRDSNKFIFLPAASCYGGEKGEFLTLPDDDVRGFYWSSTIYKESPIGAWGMSFFYRYMGTDNNLSDRAIGQNVRAVRK